MKRIIFITIEKIITYNETERKPKMSETVQTVSTLPESVQTVSTFSESKKPMPKRKTQIVIAKVKGVSLVARRTSPQKVTYYLRIFENGKQFKKRLFSASERDSSAKERAISEMKAYAAKLDTGVFTPQMIQTEKQDFLSFFEQIIQTKKHTTQKTWRNSLVHLKAWLKGKPLPFKDINRPMCYSFRTYLETLLMKGELKANSANGYLAKFKAALNLAVEYGVIAFSPAATLKAFPSEIPNIAFLTIDELQRLANTEPPKVRGYDERTFRTFLLFLALTGVRPTDAKAFCWNMIQSDFKSGYYVDFRPSKTRNKGVSFHRLHLHPDVMRLLSEHRERQINFAPENKIFIGLPKENSNTLNEFLRAWCEKANINKHLTVYGMRHTHASILLAEGTDLYTISKVLAHTSTRHTERYSHLLDESKAQAVRSLPSIFRSDT